MNHCPQRGTEALHKSRGERVGALGWIILHSSPLLIPVNVNLDGNRVLQMQLVKMRSYMCPWVPNSVWLWSLEEKGKSQGHTRGRVWGDAATSQQTAEATRRWKKQGSILPQNLQRDDSLANTDFSQESEAGYQRSRWKGVCVGAREGTERKVWGEARRCEWLIREARTLNILGKY